MELIHIREELREQLRLALVDEKQLVDGVRRQTPAELAGHPGTFRCLCRLALRRPLDPETAEMREVGVLLRRREDGWEIYELEGVDLTPEA